jgi:hypothetical protein
LTRHLASSFSIQPQYVLHTCGTCIRSCSNKSASVSIYTLWTPFYPHLSVFAVLLVKGRLKIQGLWNNGGEMSRLNFPPTNSSNSPGPGGGEVAQNATRPPPADQHSYHTTGPPADLGSSILHLLLPLDYVEDNEDWK